MPAELRSILIPKNEVGVYHVYNRCVRQESLCGFDSLRRKDNRHRKQWFLDRLSQLAGGFAIDVLDFAILDNHFHQLLRNRPDIARLWSDREVAERWCHVCPAECEAFVSARLKHAERAGDTEATAERFRNDYIERLLEQPEKIATYRERLSSISWFMKLLCQEIARRANQEDGITGKFWDYRFKSDRVLDEAHLLACSMYINLNEVRAGMAPTPESSRYTSLALRIDAIRAYHELRRQLLDKTHGDEASHPPPDDLVDEAVQLFVAEWFDNLEPVPDDLMPTEKPENQPEQAPTQFDQQPADKASVAQLAKRRNGAQWLSCVRLLAHEAESSESPAVVLAMANPFPSPRVSNKGYLPITYGDYLRLIDWTGRQRRADKRAAIPPEIEAVAKRLSLDLDRWALFVEQFCRKGYTAHGSPDSLRREAARRGRQRLNGLGKKSALPNAIISS